MPSQRERQSQPRCCSCQRFISLERAIVHAEPLDDLGIDFSFEFECTDCGGGGGSDGFGIDEPAGQLRGRDVEPWLYVESS